MSRTTRFGQIISPVSEVDSAATNTHAASAPPEASNTTVFRHQRPTTTDLPKDSVPPCDATGQSGRRTPPIEPGSRQNEEIVTELFQKVALIFIVFQTPRTGDGTVPELHLQRKPTWSVPATATGQVLARRVVVMLPFDILNFASLEGLISQDLAAGSYPPHKCARRFPELGEDQVISN